MKTAFAARLVSSTRAAALGIGWPGTALSGTPAAMRLAAGATLAEIDIPAGIGREADVASFHRAVPEHQKAPGLLPKQFILSGLGTAGGAYLWKERAKANAWFHANGRARAEATCGRAGRIECFNMPRMLPVRAPSVVKVLL